MSVIKQFFNLINRKPAIDISLAMNKLLAFTLALVMSLSVTTPAFATGSVGGNNTGGGQGNAGYSSDEKAWSSTRQGYRFYIIDKDFIRVSGVYDFLFVNPEGVGEWCGETRFDGAGTPGQSEWYLSSIQDLAAITGSTVSDIPVPVQNNTGQGDKFKAWFLRGLTGAGGVVIPQTSIRPNFSGVTQSSTTNTSSTSNGVAQSGGKSVLVQTYIMAGTILQIMIEISNPAQKMTTEERKGAVYSLASACELYDVYVSIAPSGLTKDEVNQYALGRLNRTLENAGYSLNQIIFIAGFINRTSSGTTLLSTKGLNGGYGNAVTDVNNITNISLTSNIPLANSDSDENTSTANAPVLLLLNEKAALKVSGFESAAEALFTGDYYLVVEPITWLNVGTAPGQYNSFRTYGSYYNIASKWRGNDNGGFYASYMTNLGNNCLLVGENHETSTGKVISPTSISKRGVAASLAEMNSKSPYLGLSMHLYTSDNLVGDIGLTIIKNYIDENGAVSKDNVVEVTSETSIPIDDEGNYKVVQWETSINNPPEEIGNKTPWDLITETSTSTQAGVTPTTINVTPEEMAVYIQLQLNPQAPIETEWVIEESEITKQFDTKENPETANLPSLYISLGELDREHNHPYECGGCKDSDGDGENDSCGGHDDYKEMRLSDKSLKFILKNTLRESYPNILAFKESFKDEVNPKETSVIRSSRSSSTEEVEDLQYKFIGHRGEDKLKLADFKTENNGHDSVLSPLGYKTASKNNSPTRKKTSYVTSLNIKLELDNGLSDLITSSDCEKGDKTDTDEATQNAPVAVDDTKITVKVYSGRSTSTDTEVNTNPKLSFGLSGYKNVYGRMVQNPSKIQFYPYIQMTYVTLDSAKKNVYVLGEYQRTVVPNDYAEIAWGEEEENLRLTSNQWSTHAGAMKLSEQIFGSVKYNCMLPGGAVYSLDTKTADGKKMNLRKVAFNTYQTVVPEDEEIEASTTIDDESLTIEGAINEHENFVNNGLLNLGNSYLKMFVTTNVKAENAWDNGIEVYNGADIRELDNGSSNASTDTKYYLRPEAENSDRATFDAKVVGKTTKYHRVYSDTFGNVYYVNGASVDEVMSGKGLKIFSKTQNYNGPSSLSGEAQKINQRTGFIQKFMTTIERNSGDDKTAAWASDGKWYNEAYKGIVVIEQSSTIEVGLVYPTNRSTVMDPKLTPKQTTKAQKDENGNLLFEAYMFQYKTSLSEDEPLASFKGQPVYMKNADVLFKSNKAFIINMTVQDLS